MASPAMSSSAFEDLPPILDDRPDIGSREWETIQWCEERLKRGIAFVTGQVGYDKIDATIRQIFSYEQVSGVSYTPIARPLSATRANLVAKIAEDLTAMLTDTRVFWKYSTYNAKYQKQCDLSNKGAERWYSDKLIDLRIGDVVRYYTIAGTGFAHLYYDKRSGDQMVIAEDPRNVFPIDPLSYHSIQDAKGVIVRRARTPEWFEEEFGKRVKPESGGSLVSGVFGWLQRIVEGPGDRGGPLSKKTSADNPIPHTPTVFVNTLYLKDNRVNKESRTVRLGKWEQDSNGTFRPANPWSYEVPHGMPLFPFGRMICWANGVLGYDGPSPYWHGKFPLVKLTLNPWPMSWFGKAPLWDTLPLQMSIDKNLRVVDDHAAQVAQPGVIADRNVGKGELNKFDSRQAGYKIKTNLASGKGITVVNPPPLDAIIQWAIGWCEEKMNKLAGTFDATAMASLAQLPSDDTIDTIMKTMTPATRLRSRIFEGFMKEFAEMYLYNQAEWDTLSKRVAQFGPEAVSSEDFDYDPKTFIPDDVPDGEPGDIAHDADALGRDNPRQLYQRAQALFQSFFVNYSPSSLLNSARQQEVMETMLLAKIGYADCFTLWEKMGITNGTPPNMVIPPDIASRLALQDQLGIGMIANAQGRKATNQAPPGLGQTGNGPTITTS